MRIGQSYLSTKAARRAGGRFRQLFFTSARRLAALATAAAVAGREASALAKREAAVAAAAASEHQVPPLVEYNRPQSGAEPGRLGQRPLEAAAHSRALGGGESLAGRVVAPAAQSGRGSRASGTRGGAGTRSRAIPGARPLARLQAQQRFMHHDRGAGPNFRRRRLTRTLGDLWPGRASSRVCGLSNCLTGAHTRNPAGRPTDRPTDRPDGS